MGIAKRRRAARLGPGRGKVAGANSMTLLGDEGSAPAITVLLVEDDAPTSWRLQDALSGAGYQVRAAATPDRRGKRLRQSSSPNSRMRGVSLLTGSAAKYAASRTLRGPSARHRALVIPATAVAALLHPLRRRSALRFSSARRSSRLTSTSRALRTHCQGCGWIARNGCVEVAAGCGSETAAVEFALRAGCRSAGCAAAWGTGAGVALACCVCGCGG